MCSLFQECNWNGLIEQDKDELTLRELIRGGERNVVYLITLRQRLFIVSCGWDKLGIKGLVSITFIMMAISKEALVKGRNVVSYSKLKNQRLSILVVEQKQISWRSGAS